MIVTLVSLFTLAALKPPLNRAISIEVNPESIIGEVVAKPEWPINQERVDVNSAQAFQPVRIRLPIARHGGTGKSTLAAGLTGLVPAEPE